MNEFLICRTADNQGKIVFLVYSADDGKIIEYDSAAITQKIVSREIGNAKLENSVVKITDSRQALAKLSFEERCVSSVFYIFTEYTSPHGSKIFGTVSNTGEIFELSANAAADFFSGKKIINAYLNKSGLHIINVPTFGTHLHKSLKHTPIK